MLDRLKPRWFGTPSTTAAAPETANPAHEDSKKSKERKPLDTVKDVVMVATIMLGLGGMAPHILEPYGDRFDVKGPSLENGIAEFLGTTADNVAALAELAGDGITSREVIGIAVTTLLFGAIGRWGYLPLLFLFALVAFVVSQSGSAG